MAPFTGRRRHVHAAPGSPGAAGAFEPNRILKITPEFLETAIREVNDAGYEIVSLDEAARRLDEGPGRASVRLLHLRRRLSRQSRVRLSGLQAAQPSVRDLHPDRLRRRQGDLWWLVLEAAMRKLPHVSLEMNGDSVTSSSIRPRQEECLQRDLLVAALAARAGGPRHRCRHCARSAGIRSFALCADSS